MNNYLISLPVLFSFALISACAPSGETPFSPGGTSSSNIISSANFAVTASELNPQVLEFSAGTVADNSLTAARSDLNYRYGSITSEITVTAADNNGALVSSGTVYFATQYGTLSASSCELSEGKCSVTWESITDMDNITLDDNGTPNDTTDDTLDIYIQVIAWAYGEEGFFDTDGDGLLSDNENFFDEGSPYIDVNNNGAFNDGIDQAYAETPYRLANGVYDGIDCDANTRTDCQNFNKIIIFDYVNLRLNFDAGTATP